MAGMMRRVRWLLAGATALALALTLAVFVAGGVRHTAAATDGGGGKSTMNTTNGTTCEDQTARLAANLKVSKDALQAAIKQTRLQDVDTALAGGRLTATQAQTERDRINAATNVVCVGWDYGYGYGYGPGYGPNYDHDYNNGPGNWNGPGNGPGPRGVR